MNNVAMFGCTTDIVDNIFDIHSVIFVHVLLVKTDPI